MEHKKGEQKGPLSLQRYGCLGKWALKFCFELGRWFYRCLLLGHDDPQDDVGQYPWQAPRQ